MQNATGLLINIYRISIWEGRHGNITRRINTAHNIKAGLVYMAHVNGEE